MPNPRAQQNPSFFSPGGLQGLADMGRGVARGAIAEGVGGFSDMAQQLKDIRAGGMVPAMLARTLAQTPTSEELSHYLRGMTPNPLTQPDRAHTAAMGQAMGSIPAGMAAGAAAPKAGNALQKMMSDFGRMKKAQNVMPSAPPPAAEILKGPDPDLMRVYSGQRIPIEGKFDIMRADPHASMGRAFYTAELPRYANKFTGNQPGANVVPVDVDRNKMLMFDKTYDTPQGQMEGLDYYDMLRRQAIAKPGVGKDMIRQEILDAGFAGTQMPNATGKAYAIYDPSAAQDMSGRSFKNGGVVDVPKMAFGGIFGKRIPLPKTQPPGTTNTYTGINPMATGLGEMLQQSQERNLESGRLSDLRNAQFAGQPAAMQQRRQQLADLKNTRLDNLAKQMSTYKPPAGANGGLVMEEGNRIQANMIGRSTDNAGVPMMASGGLARMQAGGLAKAGKSIQRAFKAMPGESAQGTTGMSEVPLVNIELPKIIKASEAYGPHEGKYLNITQTDRTKVGEGFSGGPGFSGIQLYDPAYAEAGWGVKTPGVAQTIVGSNRRYPEGQAIWTTMIGTPEQHRSNQMVFDALYKQFMNANKLGKLTPELKDTINNKLASVVDKEGKNLFPQDVDISNPRKFRKLVDTFDKRAAAADVMGGVGVGGKKGQIFNYDRIIRDTTDPALIDVPTGSLGNRMFQLTGEIVERPELNRAFPMILKGQDLGVMYQPVPRELVMEDYINRVLQEKGRQPGYMDWTRGYAPSQLLTETLLTKMQKAGYKKGGRVKKEAKW